MDLELSGLRALVTGASKGIGAAIARTLCAEGCETVLVARTAAGLQRVADEITAETGRSVDTVAADLSQPGEAKRLAERVGDVDILVNNAGAIPPGTIHDVGEATWRAAWDLKVFGYVNLTREYHHRMGARGSGTVVNVIGAAAQLRDPAYICGVVANAALTAFTMSLGSDSHRVGVRVVGVSPGPIATGRLETLAASSMNTTATSARSAAPDVIASAVAFLASPKSSYTSGAVLTVDGGLSAAIPAAPNPDPGRSVAGSAAAQSSADDDPRRRQ